MKFLKRIALVHSQHKRLVLFVFVSEFFGRKFYLSMPKLQAILNEKSIYVSPHELAAKFGVSSQSLRRWANDGKISTIRTPGNYRLYNKADVIKVFGLEHLLQTTEQQKKSICYARVSSFHQKTDLDRQVDDLKKHYPHHTIITDIGSGLNYHRKGFVSLLEQVFQGDVREVVVAQ
jgi:predicted site-specific integrase-resolvase